MLSYTPTRCSVLFRWCVHREAQPTSMLVGDCSWQPHPAHFLCCAPAAAAITITPACLPTPQTPTSRCTTSRPPMTCPSPTACAARSTWWTAWWRTWTSEATSAPPSAAHSWRCSAATAPHCCCASGPWTPGGAWLAGWWRAPPSSCRCCGVVCPCRSCLSAVPCGLAVACVAAALLLAWCAGRV